MFDGQTDPLVLLTMLQSVLSSPFEPGVKYANEDSPKSIPAIRQLLVVMSSQCATL